MVKSKTVRRKKSSIFGERVKSVPIDVPNEDLAFNTYMGMGGNTVDHEYVSEVDRISI